MGNENFKLKILEINSIREINGYWSTDDFINLLEEFNYAEEIDSLPSELQESLEMVDDIEEEFIGTIMRYED